MATLRSGRDCLRLEAEGLLGLHLPHGNQSPIPGLLLYVDEAQRRLVMLLPSGQAVDLLDLYRAADDCVRNWHRDSSMPQFVGDFKRLLALAVAVNGRRLP